MGDQQFDFESARFEETLAHGGPGAILFSRVLEQGRGCRFLDLSIVPPGAEIGVHTHEADNEEFYVVVAGTGLMHLDGRTFEVGPGHVIRNRPGGTHGLRNTGRVPMKLVVIEVPCPA